MTLSPIDLRAVFGLAPEQAISYIQRKGFAITWNWHDVQAAAHARAFTVAKAGSLDLLQDIRNALIDNLREGKTESDFLRELTPTLQAKGWWGKKEVEHENGAVETVRLGTPRRLKTIYQTNAQSAFMAGRYAAMREAIATHPYWQYIAVLDASTRPSHAAMHGKVFRADDPIWDYLTPPNDYNCRCRIRALTEDEVKARGLKVESSEGRMQQLLVDMGVDKRTGEIRQAKVAQIEVTDRAGKGFTFSPAPGFSSSPVAAHAMDDLLLEKAQRTLGDVVALAEVQKVLLAPARLQGWYAFVDGALAAPFPQRQSMAFGVLRPQDLLFLQRAGAQVQSGVVFVEDTLIGGAKARRHIAAENALSASEWRSLPKRFAKPERVLWDTRNRTLLYVFQALDGRASKVAVRFARLNYAGQPVDDAATVFKVAAANIEEGIASGMYTLV